MPKKRNDENGENQCPLKKIKVTKKPTKTIFKFDIKNILKERQAESEFWKKSDELDKQIKIVNNLFEEQLEQIKMNEDEHFEKQKLGYVIFKSSIYNKNVNDNLYSDLTKDHLKKLILISIEKDELKAVTHFKCLLKENWCPVFNDVKTILINWGADLDTIISKPLQETPLSDSANIRRHNFELVMNFFSYSIMNYQNIFSNGDLLTLAKFTVTIYFDDHCGQMIDVIQELFSACIEKALGVDDNDTSILTFAQELYSLYEEDDISNIIIDLFLPIKNPVMKKIYSYLTFKLFKSLLRKTNNINAFPTNINDWFVQDLVKRDFFKYNDKKILYSVIRLLEHVVITFDLYKNEEKLNNMHDFLYSVTSANRLSGSLKLINILDQWRLKLFRLRIKHVNDTM